MNSDVIDSFRGAYAFLSNFYPCKLIVDSICYPSSEHAYQAAKTLNRSERLFVAGLNTPAKAKAAGKRLTIRSNWDSIKIEVMCRVVLAKFVQNADLAEKLIDTGDALLIEGNNYRDQFWGVYNGKGRNLLGKIIMAIRDRIRTTTK